jgi:hypothetical protein
VTPCVPLKFSDVSNGPSGRMTFFLVTTHISPVSAITDLLYRST